MIKFWWQLGITDPDRDTGKTCLGGGMHCPSASSCFLWCFKTMGALSFRLNQVCFKLGFRPNFGLKPN